MNDTLAHLPQGLAIAHARYCEDILTKMLKRHYGDRLPTAVQEVMALLERDGLVLFKSIPPAPAHPEFILMRGPMTALGEKMDESKIIDRVTPNPIFQHDLSWPDVSTQPLHLSA